MSKESIIYTVALVIIIGLLWFVGAGLTPVIAFYNFIVTHLNIIPYLLLLISPVFYLSANTRLAWILMGVAFIGFLAFGVIPVSFIKL